MHDLNSTPLTTHAKVHEACDLVRELTMLLHLSEAQMRISFETTVLAYIPMNHVGNPGFAELKAYANGLLEGYIDTIRSGLCEKVYRLAERKGAGGEWLRLDTPRYFGAKVPVLEGDLPHFSAMTLQERTRARLGYSWAGSAGKVEFSAFVADSALQVALGGAR